MAYFIDPGQLRERVQIQAEAEASDGAGGYALSWTTARTVWARVRPLSGREALQAQQLQSLVQYRVTIRYRADVTAANRLLWGGKALNILAVRNPDEQRAYLELDCTEGAAT